MVRRRWAIKMLVLDLSSKIVLMFFISSDSVCASNAEVYIHNPYFSALIHYIEQSKRVPLTASSKNKISGSFNSTLATAIRCFSPPLIIRPLSPTCVL